MTFLERDAQLRQWPREDRHGMFRRECWPESLAVIQAASECRDERYIDDLQATVRALDKKAGEG